MGTGMYLVAAEHNEIQLRQPSDLAESINKKSNASFTVLPGIRSVHIEMEVGNMGKTESRHRCRVSEGNKQLTQGRETTGADAGDGNPFYEFTSLHAEKVTYSRLSVKGRHEA